MGPEITLKDKEGEDEVFYILSHQRTVWQEISASERLRRSWALRKRVKNLKKVHDKKIFSRA